MSDLISLHEEIAAELSSKASLAGVTCLAMDRLEIVNDIAAALARLGVAALVGTASGVNPTPDSIVATFDSEVGVLLIENVKLNRNRTLFSTVANPAARLAVANVPIGQAVAQTDVAAGKYRLQHDGQCTDKVDIAADASAAALQTALNAIAAISTQGSVTVTGSLAAGYTITWNTNGARNLLAGKKAEDLPLGTQIKVVRVQAGTVALPEIQRVDIRQWFWHANGSGSHAHNWAWLLTANELLQLVIQALHNWSPTVYQTLVATGFDTNEVEGNVEIVARFTMRLHVNSAAVP